MYYINNTKEKALILELINLLLEEGDESLIAQTTDDLEKQIFEYTGKTVYVDESLLTYYLGFFYEDDDEEYEEDKTASYEKTCYNKSQKFQ